MSPPFPRLPVLLLALAGAWAAPARAQSLQELYDAARGYDAAYQSVRAQVESTQFRVEQARGQNRPNVGLQALAARNNSDTPYSSPLRSGTTTQSVTLQASQQLYNKPNDITITQAEKAYDAARADLETAEQDLIVRVSQAYFDVLAAQDTLATTRTSKAAIAEQLASAKRNFEVGTATITDTREAQARFDLATAQEIAADNDLRTKAIALDQLVGRNGVAPKGLATPVVLPATPGAVDDWVQRADQEHPSIRKSRLALEIAQLDVERARDGSLPTLRLDGSYGRNHVSNASLSRETSIGPIDIPSSWSHPSGSGTSSAIGVTLNLPLYTGGIIQNQVKEKLSLEDKARNDLEAARRAVAQGTRQVFFAVQSGQAQVKALEAAESSSQLALEATQLGYKVGVRVNLDVLNAQTQLYQTRRDLAKSRYDLLVGGLRLRQAAGVLKPEDVASVNQLLER